MTLKKQILFIAVFTSLTSFGQQTWYTYKSGNWNDAAVWTLDAGVSPLYNNPSSSIPSAVDKVVITTGRTVTMNVNTVTVTELEITGTLDLASTTGHNFTTIKGKGTMKLSGNGGVENYPTGTNTLFEDHDEGGTVEVYGTGFNFNQARNYNNLVVNLTNATDAVTIMNNLTINGNLTVSKGILKFNDNSATTARTVIVKENVLVNANGKIAVGTANARHEFNLHGDFTNKGEVKFTNRNAANFTSQATDGIVDANFISSTRDQTVRLEGVTNFYRIEVNKGVDDTYILDISATSTANFKLYGFANQSFNGSQLTTNNNSLGLIYGTVKIGENVDIPRLNGGGNYCIFKGAQLWVAGGSVAKPAGTALVPYGKIRVTSGTLNVPINSGITTRESGILILEGGTVTINQLRTSVNGASAQGGLIISGGVLNITGGSTATSYYTFSLTYTGNVFNMSGGTINLSGSNTKGGIYINSSNENINVTGGTVNLDVTNGNNATITSRAPFFNLNVLRTSGSGSGDVRIVDGSSGSGGGGGTTSLSVDGLTVLNDLRINNADGHGTVFNTNGKNLNVGGSITIDNGATATLTGAGTVTLEGGGASSFDINTGATQEVSNLVIDKKFTETVVDITNGAATALRVTSKLEHKKGRFDIKGKNVELQGNLVVNDTIGTATNTGKLLMNGTVAQTITSDGNGTIYDLELNNANNFSLLGGNLSVLDQLTLTNGIFDINTFELGISKNIISANTLGSTRMIQTDGNSSDGGIVYDIQSSGTSYVFPFGVGSKYTPATLDITINNSNTGKVQIRPVNKALATANLTGNNHLQYYWRVGHSDFGSTDLPTVNSLNFTYIASDASAGTPDTEYVAGKVLDEGAFTRSYEGNDGVQLSATEITFNGLAADAGSGSGSGFTIEKANYSAGAKAAFTGAPEVYYTRLPNGLGGNKWNNSNSWTLGTNVSFDKHDSRQVAAGDFPKEGDIAVIGWTPHNDPTTNRRGFPHVIWTDNAINFAEIRFSQMKDSDGNPTARKYTYNYVFRPCIVMNSSNAIFGGGKISGEGMFWMRSGGSKADPNFSVTDYFAFARQDSSYVLYENFNASYIYQNIPSEVPNLHLGVDGWGASNKNFQINSGNITVNGNLELLGDINLILPNTATGDFLVKKDLRSYRSNVNGNDSGGGAMIDFPNTGTRRIEVLGNLRLENDASQIRVANPDATQNVHVLIVHGDIRQNIGAGNVGLLLNTGDTNDYIKLFLKGVGQHSYISTSGNSPAILDLEVNKGTDTTSTFTFSDNFTLSSSLALQNGKLILDDAAINLSLGDIGSNYLIPSTAGLEVKQGTFTTTAGLLKLDGLFRVSGGTANLANTTIEYSNTGNAKLEVLSGSLTVGRQVRRALTTTTGILKYKQTGGTVNIATNSAPDNARGVFEVVNTGSSFIHTGGTFNIRRGVTGDNNISLLINPATSNFTGSTITIFDGLGSNYGSNFFNIKADAAIGNLTIGNSIALPDVRTYNHDLEVNDLTINENQVLLANGFDLKVKGDFSIDTNGTYTNTSSNTILENSSGATNTISGSGTYTLYDLTKQGLGTYNQSVSLVATHDLFINQGTLAMGSNTLSVQHDAYVKSTITNTTGKGLIFNGTSEQNLNGKDNTTVSLGTVTIETSGGVKIVDNHGYKFDITKELRLDAGVLDLGGNLLTIKNTAKVTTTSSFGINNMIQTNSSFTDNGLKTEFYGVDADTTVFFPVGQLKYTPVQFNLNAGTSSGSIRVRPANEIHPSIVNNTEPVTETEIDDTQNALSYYWIVVADGITNANGKAILEYDQSNIQVTAPYDTTSYIPARLLSNDTNWDKFSKTLFKGGVRKIEIPFPTNATSNEITGDYTAGIGSGGSDSPAIEGAVPDKLAEYEFTGATDNDYTKQSNWTPLSGSPAVTDGVGPLGAKITVKNGKQLDLVNNVRLYATSLESNSTIKVPSGVSGVRLGSVSGTGTISVENNEVLPTGEYSEFFKCTGGGLEYGGNTDYNVLSGVSAIRRVVFSGTGIRTLPDNNLTICDELEVDGSTVAFKNQTYTIGNNDESDNLEVKSGSLSLSTSSVLDVNGDFIISGGTFTGETGTTINVFDDVTFSSGTLDWNGSSVILDGSSAQEISGTYSGTAAFNNLTLNNTGSGFTKTSGSMLANGVLTMTDGILTTTSANKLTLSSSGSWTGASTASHVSGPITKNSVPAASTYEFPTGKSGRYAPVKVVGVNTGGQNWTAEYFTNTNPTYSNTAFDNTDPGSGYNALTKVIDSDRWDISSSGVNQAEVNGFYGSHIKFVGSPAFPNNPESIRIVMWDDDTDNRWENQGGNKSSGSNATSGSTTSENKINFTAGNTEVFGLGYAPSNPLPVTLLEFKGSSENNEVLLQWSTASEENNDYFELFHSVDDGASYVSIGTVKGRGTTNGVSNYNFKHKRPALGTNIYKLVQHDINGDTEDFPVISVINTFAKTEVKITIYPNPSKSNTMKMKLFSTDNTTPILMKLIDLDGVVYFEKELDASKAYDEKVMPNTELSAGTYIMHITQGEYVTYKRVIIK